MIHVSFDTFPNVSKCSFLYVMLCKDEIVSGKF